MFEKATILVICSDETEILKKTVCDIISSVEKEDVKEIKLVYPKNVTENCLDTIKELELIPIVTSQMQKTPGITGALFDGSLASDSSHIIFMSGDYAIDPKVCGTLIKKAKENPDAIIKTSRFLEKNSFFGYDRLRLLLNKGGQIFLKLLFQTSCTDLTQPTQCTPKKIIEKINFTDFGFSGLLQFTLIPLRMKTEFVEIPAKCFGREEGNSKNSPLKTLKYFTSAIKIKLTPLNRLTK